MCRSRRGLTVHRMKDGSAPAFDPRRISEFATLQFSSGLPITADPRPKALAASIPTFPMKLSLKIPLAFAAALVLMLAGALYGIFALNANA
ncbi:methyl-accepting chemotaxis sensory transducer [Caballeronia choica]|uniref:Methyl-accepting chemotaxis sensory transducer n=2 Tax=Caballeronia choica TaxID=326476 RepID=A0A158K1C4_9BURK|nr:methyl-accepting chemotaxis sensory transducer [Caballeronia choica]